MIMPPLLKKSALSVNFDPVFVIEGQSNGVGSYTGPPSEQYLRDPIDGVYIWVTDHWEVLHYGVNCKGNTSSDHGCELMLGYLAHQHYNKNIYIIKNTLGGAGIQYFVNNAIASGTYNIDENAAINNLIALGKNPKLFFNYNQGEANVGQSESYFLPKLRELRDDKRANLPSATNMKFVTCRLSVNSIDWCIGIYNAQTDFGGDANCAYYNQDDLLFGSDSLHFTSESQNIIASRFFNLTL